MKFSLFVCCSILATIVVASEAMAYRMPVYYGGLQNYYYPSGQTETPKHDVPTNHVAKNQGGPYQKHIACVPWRFFFDDCTLCFCSSIPNVAFCWDYEVDECTLTRKLLDEQKNAKNNDPYGIW